MALGLMELRERFSHRPLVPDELAKQQSEWRQRWGLPARPVHTASTSWSYYIDPVRIAGHAAPDDPRLRLRFALLNEADEGKYFLTGNKGAGKSTAAHSLWQDEEIKERFCLLGCSVADYLNLADLDASQVLAVMIAHLIEAIRDAKRDADLGIDDAHKALKSLDKVLSEARPNAELEKVTIDAFGLFTAQFKESKSTRDVYRQYVDGHFDELMALFDRLVDILEKHRQKKVLFVIDDLDKIGSFDINKNVFQLDLSMLLRPRCAAVYTFPLEVHQSKHFSHLKSQPNRFLLGNIKLISRPGGRPGGELLDQGRKILQQFIQCRLEPGDTLDTYFDTALLDRVFFYSCGNYRELCRILQHALQTGAMLGKERVDGPCLESALRQLRTDYNPFLQRNRRALQAVRDNLTTDEPEDLDDNILGPLIQSLAVVEYPDDPGWLDVHPVLKDLMDGKPSGL